MTASAPISQCGERYEFDVVVLGSGVAGLTYALSLAAKDNTVKIALVSKQSLDTSNSYWAQGGIAAVSLHSDSLARHVQDTLKAGDGLCNEEVVNAIVSQGAQAIAFLQQQGVQFDLDGNTFDLAQEGGHSDRRIYHVGDQTGMAIITALLASLHQYPNITVFEYATAVNLITQIQNHQPGALCEVIGCYILAEQTGLIHTFLAKVTILATGGAGKVYRYTTNPDVATGDGVAMAYRAGARVGNLEFIQFHPTLLYHRERNNFLITEALRGEGAYLRAPGTGERFMTRYAPEQMELATRDIVARAIFTEIEHSSHSFVHLDVRHLEKSYLQKRFPAIDAALRGVGIDMSHDLIPVVPAAHYVCGGVLADINGKTDLTGLYAIGEVAFTGFHGANRLASNSLLEGIVMGLNAAISHEGIAKKMLTLYKDISNWTSSSVVDIRRASQINAHWRGLRGEMTSYAGIVRTKAGLEDLVKLIKMRRDMIENYYWGHVVTADVVELRNIALLAELIVRSALAREESRGGHFREDCIEQLLVAEESFFREAIETRTSQSSDMRPSE